MSFANFNEAFKNIKDSSINQSTDLYSEKCYMNTQKKENENFSKYQNTNYRNKPNNKYNTKINSIYLYQGINDGKGPGQNVDVDDKLTRGNFHVKPVDKLAEIKTFENHIHFKLHSCVDNNHKNFLTSTKLSCEPQTNYKGGFDKQGISTSNYGRKNYKKN
jgi:hypothetical protein